MKKHSPPAVLKQVKRLLLLIPPNLALEPEAFEDLEMMLGAAMSRVKAIRSGRIFTPENSPRPPSEEQLIAAMANWQPPTPEQIEEMERFNKGPTRSDRKRYGQLLKRRDLLKAKLSGVEKELDLLRRLIAEGDRHVDRDRAKHDVIDDLVRAMAERGMTPGEISQSLLPRFGYPPRLESRETHAPGSTCTNASPWEVEDPYRIPPESLSEKAINTRLFRLRSKGFRQPISPTAKNRRKKT